MVSHPPKIKGKINYRTSIQKNYYGDIFFIDKITKLTKLVLLALDQTQQLNLKKRRQHVFLWVTIQELV